MILVKIPETQYLLGETIRRIVKTFQDGRLQSIEIFTHDHRILVSLDCKHDDHALRVVVKEEPIIALEQHEVNILLEKLKHLDISREEEDLIDLLNDLVEFVGKGRTWREYVE